MEQLALERGQVITDEDKVFASKTRFVCYDQNHKVYSAPIQIVRPPRIPIDLIRNPIVPHFNL